MSEIPYGYCHCGCGQKTRLSPYSWKRRGWVEGKPQRYKQGHSSRRKCCHNNAWSYHYRKIMTEYLGRALDRQEVVHHINGDRTDNRLSNLDIMLHHIHSQCHIKKYITENCKRYENHHKAKLKNEDIPYIRYLMAIGKPINAICRMYDVAPVTIRDIRNSKTWIEIK